MMLQGAPVVTETPQVQKSQVNNYECKTSFYCFLSDSENTQVFLL